MSEGILAGLKVLDCASYVAGPGAATLMADFGADVIKIEPPEGDAYRHAYWLRDQPEPKHNYYWIFGSRNKRSMAIDLKAAAGLEILNHLLDGADVFITNLPLVARRRLGISFDTLSAKRPRLIYASFTAYGETGPEAEKPGFDATSYWGRSGLMDVMRADRQADPIRPSQGIGDNPAAVNLYAAIVTALFRREQTGVGGEVTVSLLGSGLWANALDIQATLCDVAPLERAQRTDTTMPLINTYRCGDGRWLNLMILKEGDRFNNFLKALDLQHLIDDERFAAPELRRRNARTLIEILDLQFATRSFAEWSGRLQSYSVTFDVISDLAYIKTDVQALAIGAITPTTYDPSLMTVNGPFAVTGAPKTPPGPAPGLGEHSQSILKELGVSETDIAQLFASGVVVGSDRGRGNAPGAMT